MGKRWKAIEVTVETIFVAKLEVPLLGLSLAPKAICIR
jgi:hypothetical protein